MIRLLLLTVLIAGYTTSQATGFDFKDQVNQLKHLSEETFLDQFPFRDYIQQYGIDKIALLETQKIYLNSINRNGDEFIIRLFETYMQHISLDFKNIDSIKQQLLYAEIATHSENYLPDSIYIYQIAGGIMLETISDTLEYLIKEKLVDLGSFEIKYLINRLGDNKYYIDIRKPNFQKLIDNLRKGNIGYIIHKATSTYRKEFMIFLSITLPVILVIIVLSRRLYKKRKKQQI